MLIKPCLATLRSFGISCLAYLDDIPGAAMTAIQARTDCRVVIWFFRQCSFIIEPDRNALAMKPQCSHSHTWVCRRLASPVVPRAGSLYCCRTRLRHDASTPRLRWQTSSQADSCSVRTHRQHVDSSRTSSANPHSFSLCLPVPTRSLPSVAP